MVANLALAGLDDSGSLEAAVQRWITRLEVAHRLTRCEVSIRVGTTLFGLLKRAEIELSLSTSAHDVTVHRAERFHDETELFSVISNAFRDAHHRLDRGTTPTAGG